MRIAITCEDKTLDSPIDQRFGRCRFFIIVDIEDGEIRKEMAVTNEGAKQGHGAGIRAAEQLGEQKVSKVITGQLGPNASTVLEGLGIDVYHGDGIARSAIDELIKDNLKRITKTVEAHSGIVRKKDDVSERMFFPLLNDKGLDSELSEHFGHAPYFGVYDFETEDFKVIKNELEHNDPSKTPIDQISDLVSPTTIFAKSIGRRAIGLIQQRGLRLKTGNFRTPREVIEHMDDLEEQTESCGH
jgi:predicted Fe-Mo cluster-binding NifX family protein